MTAVVQLACHNSIVRETFITKLRHCIDAVQVSSLNPPFELTALGGSDYIVINDADSDSVTLEQHLALLNHWLQNNPHGKVFVRAGLNTTVNRQLPHPSQLIVVQSDFGFCQLLPEFIAMDWRCRQQLAQL